MEIRFKCPCGIFLGAPEDTAGRQGRCPTCSKVIRIPSMGGGSASNARRRPPAWQPPREPRESVAPQPSARPPAGQPAAPEKRATAPPSQRPPAAQPPPSPQKAKPKPTAEEVAAAEIPFQELLRQAQALGAEAEKGSVVVADSDPSALNAIRKMLEDHGYEVFAASDGTEALAMIREKAPSLAVLDLKLDRMSGFQVISVVTDQFDPPNKHVWQTPFIMTCNKATGRDRQYAISLGVKYYFEKPLKPNVLCASIEKALGRYRSK